MVSCQMPAKSLKQGTDLSHRTSEKLSNERHQVSMRRWEIWAEKVHKTPPSSEDLLPRGGARSHTGLRESEAPPSKDSPRLPDPLSYWVTRRWLEDSILGKLSSLTEKTTATASGCGSPTANSKPLRPLVCGEATGPRSTFPRRVQKTKQHCGSSRVKRQPSTVRQTDTGRKPHVTQDRKERTWRNIHPGTGRVFETRYNSATWSKRYCKYLHVQRVKQNTQI